MSRDGKLGPIPWADGNHEFCLKWGFVIELQEKCDAGPHYILQRLQIGQWLVQDISETIRLGLIGGGMEPGKALGLVQTYVEARPLLENHGLAMAILAAAIMGVPDEMPDDDAPPGEGEDAGELEAAPAA
jgi:hypothetical protein